MSALLNSLSVVGNKRFSPAQGQKEKKSPAVTVSKVQPLLNGTPQSANPTALLKTNMRERVKEQLEAKLSRLPPSSPYNLLEGETESGSPTYAFTRLNEKPRASFRHLTGTPGLGVNRSTRARKNIGRTALSPLGNESEERESFSEGSGKQNATAQWGNDSENMENECPQECAPDSPRPELLTGSLASACSIM